MTWFAKHTVERLSCVVVWYEACPRSKVVGQFRPGRFGVPPMSPPVLGAMVLPAEHGQKGQKANSEDCDIQGAVVGKKMFHEHSLTLTMCCNNTSIAPFFTCHMSLNPPPLKQDAGTNLFQTHSPGLGFSNFRCAGRKFKFHLQKKKKHQELEDC